MSAWLGPGWDGIWTAMALSGELHTDRDDFVLGFLPWPVFSQCFYCACIDRLSKPLDNTW